MPGHHRVIEPALPRLWRRGLFFMGTPLKRYRHLAERVFDTPLLIEPSKLRTIAEFLLPRIEGHTADVADVTEGRSREELTIKDGIAVIDVFGTLVQRSSWMNAVSGLTSYEQLNSELTEAVANPEVKGILMVIDSPGGEAAGVFDFADRVAELSGGEKPIWAIAEDMATSAAYLIGSSASKFFVTQNAVTGSVGVVMAHIDQSGYDDRVGVKVTEIYAGKRKVDTSPHRPLTKDAKANLQSLVNKTYDVFVEHVARNTGLSEGAVRNTEAGLFVGGDAVKEGLASGILNLNDTLTNMRDFITTGIDMEKNDILANIRELSDEERAELSAELNVPDEATLLEKVKKVFLGDDDNPPVIHDAEVKTALETLEADKDKLAAEKERLEAELAEKKDAERQAEALKRVNELSVMGFTEEDADALLELPDATYDKLVAFKSQSAIAELFGELGKTGNEDGQTAQDRIKAAALEVKRENPTLSMEECEAKAVEDNPELYKEYLRDNPKQVQ